MNILVCVKQVPASSEVKVDEQTGVLLRSSARAKLNPYDLYALETAFELSERVGGTVTAISMGPPQAEEALRETLEMGADEAILLTDRRFAGADVLATARALAGAVGLVPDFDLIICGKQTTDGDTAQVGAELAELLSIAHDNNVTDIVKVHQGEIVFKSTSEHSIVTRGAKLPILISVEKDINTPRLPSLRRRMQTQNTKVKVVGLEQLEQSDERFYGLSGSPTQVRRIFPPPQKEEREIITGSGKQLADKLFEVLKSKKMLEG